MMKKCWIALVMLIVFCVGTSASFAAADPAVTLISPPENELVVTNNFLVSVKATQPGKTLKINAYALQQRSGEEWVPVLPDQLEEFDSKAEEEKNLAAIMEEADFESKGAVSFFTYKIENITPGVYLIRVDTLDASGKVVFSKEARILVKEKTEEETKVFETPKSGTSQFLQNILSKIFKN
ncbi:MAG: hypothetical protein LBT26_12335 [Clostridiales Family XIII bacterium]|jgi:hypothetical protein|nr:hypothetical protein [Clostridiales Family XIII bacterium]